MANLALVMETPKVLPIKSYDSSAESSSVFEHMAVRVPLPGLAVLLDRQDIVVQ